MSTYYDIVCEDCNEAYFCSSRSAGMAPGVPYPVFVEGEVGPYKVPYIGAFLFHHENHRLRFVSEYHEVWDKFDPSVTRWDPLKEDE